MEFKFKKGSETSRGEWQGKSNKINGLEILLGSKDGWASDTN